jgi:aldehyde dehydrogenase (NAD+)
VIADAPLHLLPQPGLLIGDQRLCGASGGEYLHVYAATGRPTAVVGLAGAPEMAEAVRAARRALRRWQGMPANERRRLMLRMCQVITEHADQLSALQTLESGVPRRFARAFPANAVDHLEYYAGWADKIGGDVIETWQVRALDYALDEPYGVVALIIPWNGALVSLGQLLGPVLAAGNTVVVKPPERAPFTSMRLGELILDAGFPPGVVNIAPAGPEGGAALVRSPGVDKIHFTGSGETAKCVLGGALDNLTPVCLELGGKSAHVIFADANLKAAARHAITGVVAASGQGCLNGTRVLVESSVYDEVMELAQARLRTVVVGDPLADTTSMGPVIDAAACDRLLGLIARARDRGDGRLVLGGERLGGELASGYFIAPTVFADVDGASEISQQEIFGPVLSFLRFDGEDEAVRLANGTRYGLAAYLHTNDVRRAHRMARAMDVGCVWVNGFYGLSPAVPFGGSRQSGYGRVGGRAGIREFTRPKNVWIAL